MASGRLCFRRLNKSSYKADKSISVVLNLVTSLCRYDKKEFVKNHLFESVMPTLVELIQKLHENEDFVAKSLAPCIAQLCNAVARSDNSIHANLLSEKTPMVKAAADPEAEKFTNIKSVHYEILLKTRYKNSKIRLASLVVLEEMIRVLGIHYESLWAEAIPIFHELFEDEIERVAEKTRVVCAMVKEIVGDDIEGF